MIHDELRFLNQESYSDPTDEKMLAALKKSGGLLQYWVAKIEHLTSLTNIQSHINAEIGKYEILQNPDYTDIHSTQKINKKQNNINFQNHFDDELTKLTESINNLNNPDIKALKGISKQLNTLQNNSKFRQLTKNDIKKLSDLKENFVHKASNTKDENIYNDIIQLFSNIIDIKNDNKSYNTQTHIKQLDQQSLKQYLEDLHRKKKHYAKSILSITNDISKIESSILANKITYNDLKQIDYLLDENTKKDIPKNNSNFLTQDAISKISTQIKRSVMSNMRIDMMRLYHDLGYDRSNVVVLNNQFLDFITKNIFPHFSVLSSQDTNKDLQKMLKDIKYSNNSIYNDFFTNPESENVINEISEYLNELGHNINNITQKYNEYFGIYNKIKSASQLNKSNTSQAFHPKDKVNLDIIKKNIDTHHILISKAKDYYDILNNIITEMRKRYENNNDISDNNSNPFDQKRRRKFKNTGLNNLNTINNDNLLRKIKDLEDSLNNLKNNPNQVNSNANNSEIEALKNKIKKLKDKLKEDEKKKAEEEKKKADEERKRLMQQNANLQQELATKPQAVLVQPKNNIPWLSISFAVVILGAVLGVGFGIGNLYVLSGLAGLVLPMITAYFESKPSHDDKNTPTVQHQPNNNSLNNSLNNNQYSHQSLTPILNLNSLNRAQQQSQNVV